MSAVMIVIVASFALLYVDGEIKEIDFEQNVSYISLAEDAELDEALKNENNSSVEGLL